MADIYLKNRKGDLITSKEVDVKKEVEGVKNVVVGQENENIKALLAAGFVEIPKAEYDKLRAEKIAARKGAPAPVKEEPTEDKPAKKPGRPKKKG